MLAFQADERTERVDAFDGHVLRRDHDGQPAVFADFHRLPVVEPVRDADEVVDGLLAVRDRTVAEIKPHTPWARCWSADLDGLVEFRLVVHRFPVESFEVVYGRLQLHVDLETDRPLLVRVGAFEQFHLRELVLELHAFDDVRVSGGDGFMSARLSTVESTSDASRDGEPELMIWLMNRALRSTVWNM